VSIVLLQLAREIVVGCQPILLSSSFPFWFSVPFSCKFVFSPAVFGLNSLFVS